PLMVNPSPQNKQNPMPVPDQPETALLRRRWDERYLSGVRPWDNGQTPPEVIEFWQSGLLSPAGLAVDLGCGSGVNCAYLASLGQRVIGVDLSGIALSRAQAHNAERLGPSASRVSFVQADVMLLPLSGATAHYILDIGCLHSVPRPQRPEYARSVADNLRPGGYYHLFAFDWVGDSNLGPTHSDRGLGEEEVHSLFTPAFSVLTVRRGQPDQQPCRWYLLCRQTA
ncbi:MAG: methyltransferase domain-containing protein, partial [Chloroflexota bacterium]|nr:methyltransferase domain-containing protein [Chloroflexota bacterium]